MFGGTSLTDKNKYYNVAALITFHHGILCMREIFITIHKTMRLKCQKKMFDINNGQRRNSKNAIFCPFEQMEFSDEKSRTITVGLSKN